MSSIAALRPSVKSLPRFPSATMVILAWKRQGWIEGFPRHLEEWVRLVDEGIVAKMICPQCERRGMKYLPFQRHRDYRVLALCERCGASEEF